MKKIILSIFLILSIFCCSCTMKQKPPLSEKKYTIRIIPLPKNKYIIKGAPFCLTSASLIEQTLIMPNKKTDIDIYMAFDNKNKGCSIIDDNLHIMIIKSAFGISKIKIKNKTINSIGYTFDEFVYLEQ